MSNLMAAIITRDDIVTFLSILISILFALVTVHYAERFQRRRRSGEDYQYGLHLLEALAHLEKERLAAERRERESSDEDRRPGKTAGERRAFYDWESVCKEATKRINSSTDATNYKVKDKEHSRQLREACATLRVKKAVLVDGRKDSQDASSDNDRDKDWVKERKWCQSSLGAKVMHRVKQREARDEQHAVFELFYRTGSLPSPMAGEEHGEHHQQYLEKLLPDRNARGDFVMRADDKPKVGFLMRARIRFQNEDGDQDDREQDQPIEFRYIDLPPDAAQNSAGSDQINVDLDPARIREKVDRAWPPTGLSASRLDAHRTLIMMNDSELTKSRNRIYDVVALQYRAWEMSRDSIVADRNSAIDDQAQVFRHASILRKAVELLWRAEEEDTRSNYEKEIDAFSRSYPDDIVDEVSRIMSQHGEDPDRDARKQTIEELQKLMKERNLCKVKLPKIDRPVDPSEVELESWVAFLPDDSALGQDTAQHKSKAREKL